VRSGKLRALAVSGLQRANIHPDVPTIAESGLAGFEVVNQYGLFAPAGTPPAVISAINEVVGRGMNAPDVAKWLIADGSEAAPPAPAAAFRAAFIKDYERVENIITRLNIRAN
jgi:tripartite-type tricarboxylate transporter receptor subunit TctC